MKWLLGLLATPASAYLRFGCSQLSVQRLDPIVEPGAIPSAHLHQIVGGNAFNATMDPAKDPSDRATCTTCVFSEDTSNYWTGVLYFKAQNGSYIRVKQYPNSLLGNLEGGMTVYYIQQDFSRNGAEKITAFKPGFRMTVGSPTNKGTDGRHPGLSYTCLQNINTRTGETETFPNRPCPAGIMANHHFPYCWDGKNLDSPNHQDHMWYGGMGGFISGRACPPTHPIRMPQVAYETMWDTRPFNDKSLWPSDGSQPFVWSFGDQEGHGTHADYLFGWKADALQRAMDDKQLTNDGALKKQSVQLQNTCKVSSMVNEDYDNWTPDMPGQDSHSIMKRRLAREARERGGAN